MVQTNRIGPSRRTEYVIAAAVFAIACLLFTVFKLIRSDQMLGDSAMYFQGTENLARRGVAVSQVQASIVDYLNLNTYLVTPTEKIAQDPAPLFGRPAAASERSLFLGHAYFALYPIALIVKFVPVRTVLMALYALSFIGMLCLVYFLLRLRDIAIAAAALFCLLVIAQPTWWEGILFGQFYPDRLFLLAGLGFMALATRDVGGNLRSNRVLLLVVGLLCASINERGSLVAGGFLLLYVLLYWKKAGLDRYFKLALSIGLLVYGYAALKFVLPTDAAYGSFLPTSLSGLIGVFQGPRFVPLVSLFLLVNLPLLLLALFEWRAAVIAVALMAPNILGTLGGSEKIGWSTHYVSFFFPSLVWAAMSGYVVLYKWAAIKKRTAAVYAIPAAFILFLTLIQPYSFSPLSVSFSNMPASFIPTLWQQADLYLVQSGTRASLKQAGDTIVQTVPRNSLVSSIEAGMPLLYPDRTIEYFPKDIDNADYAVLGAYVSDGKIIYNGALSYLGADEQKKFTDLVLARMRRDRYDLDHPKIFPAYVGLAVVRRIH